MRQLSWILAGVFLALAALAARRELAPQSRSPQVARASIQRLAPARATLTFVGDIMLAGRVGKVAAAAGVGHIFAGVRDLLRRDDLSIGNLECAVARGGAPEDKRFTFRADPALLPGLHASGIEAVSLANNHSLDYGRVALVETLNYLRDAGIAAAGAGRTLDEATRPVMLSADRQTVALIAASRVLPASHWYAAAGRAGLAAAYDPTPILAAIRHARDKADIVAVYLHWGKEGATHPAPYQRELGRRCIEAGADVVVGAHPHVLQGFEYYRGKLIAYSLGNFVFTSEQRATAMLQTTFEAGRLERAEVVPCHITEYCPSAISDPWARRQALRSLQERSYGVRIGDDGSLAAESPDSPP